MYLTIKNTTNDRYTDIINTLLSYNDEQLEMFINLIKPQRNGMNNVHVMESIDFYYKEEVEKYKYFLNTSPLFKRFRTPELTKEFESIDANVLIGNLLISLKQSNDIAAKNIIEKFNKYLTKEYFISLAEENEEDRNDLLYALNIIESDEEVDKFIYDQSIDHNKYIIILARLFGSLGLDIDMEQPIFKFIFINDEMINRYLMLRNKYNIDIKLIEDVPFGDETIESYTKGVQMAIDNDWDMDEDLREAILNGISECNNIEEKIVHIYIRMCELLEYDSSYMLKNDLEKRRDLEYSKGRLEGINLNNNKVICTDFAKICSKLINELSDEIDGRCYNPQRTVHQICGVMIKKDNVRVDFEPVQKFEGLNDFSRAKLSLPILGVKYIADRDNIFKEALNNVYVRLMNQHNDEEFVEDFKALINIGEDKVYTNIDMFLEQMKVRNVRGTELIIVFDYLNKRGYFNNLDYSLIGSFDKTRNITRDILFMLGDNVCVIKTESLEIDTLSLIEINDMFKQHRLIYENKDRTIAGIG